MARDFNLVESMMEAVSNLDTSAAAPEVKMIPLWDIVPNEGNFYQLTELDALASSIAMDGLQQPLIVTPVTGQDGKYRLISGHRRRAALEKLAEDGEERFRSAPCFVRTYQSEAMAQLQLILANSTTRVLTDFEKSEQAKKMELLLYQLKEEGFTFPGRMRDQVAAACQVSTSKLARLKVIREKLIPDFMAKFEADKLNEAAAYALARIPEELQERVWSALNGKVPNGNAMEKILSLYEMGARWEARSDCPEGKTCSGERFLKHDLINPYDTCKGDRCCLECGKAARDWNPCEFMCPAAKAKRKDAKAEKERSEEERRIDRARACQTETQKNAQRLWKAIEASGRGDDEVFLWVSYWDKTSVGQVREWAAGSFDESADKWTEPRLAPDKLREVKAAAEFFRCSADFLLGLSEELHGGVSNLDTVEKTNGDRIREMSDEELAAFLHRLAAGEEEPYCRTDDCGNGGCLDCALGWLKEAVDHAD